MIWIVPALVLLGSYILGSIPFGLIVTRIGGVGDLRAIGSGNIGATNVLRTGHKGLAALTLLLDGAKGAVAVIVADALAPGLGALAAVGVLYGHIFPVWLRFRGGKGVATFIGVSLALLWPSGIMFLAIWLLASLISRHSSVGGMCGALAAPVTAAFLGEWALTIVFLAFALTILWTHRANIDRLLAGTEPVIGRS